MRLINTQTLKFESFVNKKIPPYAILSHTWGNDHEEISFSDLQNGRINKSSLGWTKLMGTCRQAEQDRLAYAWIDTCCIDKSNVAELNEAINSMYRWYRQSAVCYTYLSDVDAKEEPSNPGSKFRKSRWFTRGWTLQELVAPQSVRFYSSDWQCIGNKGKMCSTIMDITGVPRSFLLGIADLQEASVAQRMSWASRRDTKHAEDLAYCLIGIFNVTMPMLYGEGGPMAFFRLQQEILKRVKDDSIFAWNFRPDGTVVSQSGPVIGGAAMATSAKDFAHCEDIVVREIHNSANVTEISGGYLQIYLPVVDVSHHKMGLLGCGPSQDAKSIMAMPLAIPSPAASQEYVRPKGHNCVLLRRARTAPQPQQIYVKLAEERSQPGISDQEYWLCEIDKFAQAGLDLIDVAPRSSYDPDRALITPVIAKGSSNRTILRFRRKNQNTRDFVVVLEKAGPTIKTRCYLMVCGRNTTTQDLTNEKLYVKMRTPLGERGASDGSLHLQVVLESIDTKVLGINPQRLQRAPTETLDATAELQRLR